MTHVHGDVLTHEQRLLGGPFDFCTSWLAFLHISDKPALLTKCASVLRPGGVLFVEDFYEASPFTTRETEMLRRDVYATDLPSRAQYEDALRAAGFEAVEWRDMAASWTRFVAERAAAWEAAEERTLRVHGRGLFEARQHFFRSMEQLFGGGRLGGVRFAARRAA